MQLITMLLGAICYRFSNLLSFYVTNFNKKGTPNAQLTYFYCGYATKLLVFALLTYVCMLYLNTNGVYYIVGTFLSILGFWLENTLTYHDKRNI